MKAHICFVLMVVIEKLNVIGLKVNRDKSTIIVGPGLNNVTVEIRNYLIDTYSLLIKNFHTNIGVRFTREGGCVCVFGFLPEFRFEQRGRSENVYSKKKLVRL